MNRPGFPGRGQQIGEGARLCREQLNPRRLDLRLDPVRSGLGIEKEHRPVGGGDPALAHVGDETDGRLGCGVGLARAGEPHQAHLQIGGRDFGRLKQHGILLIAGA